MPDSAWNSECFASELTSTLAAMLAERVDAVSLARVVSQCAAAADAVCRQRLVACTAGCPHCCVLNVAVLLPEALLIAGWLRARLRHPQLNALRVRMAEHCRRVRWMEDDERISKRVTCPLLDAAGSCSIHPVRPLVCRAVASFDRASCREAFDPIITDQERRVSADLLRQRVFDQAFMALAMALGQRGLDDRSIELGRGVLAFLEQPDLGQRLLAGECLPLELWQ